MWLTRREMMSRSVALTAVVCAAPRAGWVASAGALGDPEYFKWTPTRDKRTLVASGPGGNTVLILPTADQQGGLLVDLQPAPFGAAIKREAQKQGATVAHVVNTHHHADITGANHAFVGSIPVIGHLKAKPRIAGQLNKYVSQVKEFFFVSHDGRDPAAVKLVQEDWKKLHGRVTSLKEADFEPTELVDTPTKDVAVGGRKVVIHCLSGAKGAHTDNDLVVVIPESNVVCAGGLVSYKVHPEIDRDGGASIDGWLEALDALEKLAPDTWLVIPGEGAVGQAGVIKWQREYLKAIRKLVADAMRAGKSRQDIRKMKLPPRWNDCSLPDRLPVSLNSIYEELSAAGASTPGQTKPK